MLRDARSLTDNLFPDADRLVQQLMTEAFQASVGREAFVFDPMPAMDSEAVSLFVWDLLRATKFSQANVRLALNGEIIEPPKRHVRGRPYTDPRRLFDGLKDGQTFNLNGVEKLRPDLRIISDALQNLFQVPVQANLYISYAGATAGYGAHKDFHDVLVLQLSGTKRWTIYDQAPSTPPLKFRAPSETELAQPKNSVTLASGSCIYVPAGSVHNTETLGGISVHLTFGIACWTWRDVLSDVLAAAETDVLSRRVPFNDSDSVGEFSRFIAPALANVFCADAVMEACEERRSFGALTNGLAFIRRAMETPRGRDDR